MKLWFLCNLGGELMAFHEGLFESCKKSGAEAMKVCEQDAPKSGVDLEGA